MTKLKFGIEKATPGFFLLMAIFFIVLKILKIQNLTFLEDIPTYFLPYISIAIVIASYILGIIFNFLVEFIFAPIAAFLEFRDLFSLKQIKEKKPHIYKFGRRSTWPHGPYVKFLQYGSEYLINEINTTLKQKELIRSLVAIVPIVGGSLGFWIWSIKLKRIALVIWIITIICFVIGFIAYLSQRKDFIKLRNAVIEELNQDKSKNKN